MTQAEKLFTQTKEEKKEEERYLNFTQYIWKLFDYKKVLTTEEIIIALKKHEFFYVKTKKDLNATLKNLQYRGFIKRIDEKKFLAIVLRETYLQQKEVKNDATSIQNHTINHE